MVELLCVNYFGIKEGAIHTIMVLPFVIWGIVAAISIISVAEKARYDRYLASPAGKLAEAERRRDKANQAKEKVKEKYRNVNVELERLRLTRRERSKR